MKYTSMIKQERTKERIKAQKRRARTGHLDPCMWGAHPCPHQRHSLRNWYRFFKNDLKQLREVKPLRKASLHNYVVPQFYNMDKIIMRLVKCRSYRLDSKMSASRLAEGEYMDDC